MSQDKQNEHTDVDRSDQIVGEGAHLFSVGSGSVKQSISATTTSGLARLPAKTKQQMVHKLERTHGLKVKVKSKSLVKHTQLFNQSAIQSLAFLDDIVLCEQLLQSEIAALENSVDGRRLIAEVRTKRIHPK